MLPARKSMVSLIDTVHPSGRVTTDFLGQLSRQDHDDLLKITRRETVAKGHLCFRAGEQSAHVYFLESGIVRIYEVSDVGRDAILWFCLPGEVFGLAEAVAGGYRGVSAQAVEKSEVRSIHGDMFRHYLASHPQAALLSLQALSARLRGLGNMLVNLISDDVHTRLGKLLIRLSMRYGKRVGTEIVLQIPLTHQAISDMIGAARPTVSSALGDLKRKGVLRIDGHRIRIESEERLHELAYS
jgi:CRP/FNR family transcriptional regulator